MFRSKAEKYLEELFALEGLKWKSYEPWAERHTKALSTLLNAAYRAGVLDEFVREGR